MSTGAYRKSDITSFIIILKRNPTCLSPDSSFFSLGKKWFQFDPLLY
ncbi:hypothetical protein CLOSTMETH_03673 [[Clostridium] methylpentosum DSM 5476]|uniref:Uncharacterized protein n=1 Tax=[Clostridium] methylpentosum DSM 5476 TaxID=537013 RepID=C0EIH8_9FIRM|nr:hypothetical protein CLOSTMETH_03673 [[Clostridium] methylpentosum DSM 5476]